MKQYLKYAKINTKEAMKIIKINQRFNNGFLHIIGEESKEKSEQILNLFTKLK